MTIRDSQKNLIKRIDLCKQIRYNIYEGSDELGRSSNKSAEEGKKFNALFKRKGGKSMIIILEEQDVRREVKRMHNIGASLIIEKGVIGKAAMTWLSRHCYSFREYSALGEIMHAIVTIGHSLPTQAEVEREVSISRLIRIFG